MSNIFSREAELSGVSEDEGLFVQELVQHVAVRVDNANSAANELSGEDPKAVKLKHNLMPWLRTVNLKDIFFLT